MRDDREKQGGAALFSCFSFQDKFGSRLKCSENVCFSDRGSLKGESMAVSYTHLDVYKRQELGCSLRRSPSRCSAALEPASFQEKYRDRTPRVDLRS